MRRALVLSSESARHPYRASLPANVLESGDGTVAGSADGAGWRERLSLSADDLKGFLTAYGACLVAVFTFIV
jgi:hypothetical protein